ncbi:DNA/RNA non-specific endonuclease [Terrisporobacter sp.]
MRLLRFLMIFILSFTLVGCDANNQTSGNSSANSLSISGKNVTLNNLPKYAGEPFVAINNNEPNFSEKDKNTKSFETYSYMKDGKRAGVAYANIGRDLMPKDDRESISSVTPTGWVNKKYDIVSGGYLYNRCHLIGYQLTGEGKDTPENLITGTRYLNIDGMLPFENMVADYIKETGNHVLYRVTPIYDGNDLVAKGVQMQALSVEDNGEGIKFNVFVYNVQPGITIDYVTGENYLSKDGSTNKPNQSSSNNETNLNNNTNNQTKVEIRGNKSSKIYHCPGQANYEKMKDSSNLVIFSSEQQAINAGYTKAKR